MDEVMIFGVSITDLIAFVLITLLTILMAKGTYVLVRRLLDEHLTHQNSKAMARVYQYAVLATGVYFGFWEVLGLDLAALLASLGILGLGVALASQQILMNAFAGLLLSVIRPIKVNEWIEISGIPLTGLCRVKDINLTNTVLRDLDGRLLYVPNSYMVTNKVINYTRAGFVALRIPIWLRSLQNFDHIRTIVFDEAHKHIYILPNVGEDEQKKVTKLFELNSVRKYLEKRVDISIFAPEVLIKDIQKEKVKVEIKIWIRDVSRRDQIITTFLDNLRKRFELENIEFGNE
jgi:small conductance mechanosensitive channel